VNCVGANTCSSLGSRSRFMVPGMACASPPSLLRIIPTLSGTALIYSASSVSKQSSAQTISLLPMQRWEPHKQILAPTSFSSLLELHWNTFERIIMESQGRAVTCYETCAPAVASRQKAARGSRRTTEARAQQPEGGIRQNAAQVLALCDRASFAVYVSRRFPGVPRY
jgi:hypothetical protein